jgi:hypothetical protein
MIFDRKCPVMVLLVCAAMIGSIPSVVQAAEPLVIVEDSRSDYRIIHEPNVPSSVIEAAAELQRYVAEATGVLLPIQPTESAPDAPYICLGEHLDAQRIGIDTREVPLEGYRIITRNGNLYILGPDTPDGTFTSKGGFSAGTRNGVYAFLEDYLDIRWLMPGDRGDDVPRTNSLIVKPVHRTDSPHFLRRRMPVIQTALPEVRQWMQRSRLGKSVEIKHFHNWQHVVPPSMYDEHPDWFAMIDGKRVRPDSDDDRYKLETTNTEVVEYFAEVAKQAFREDPHLYCFSLSPSDSANYSESPESLALQETDWRGDLSVSPLVIKFYNDVARIVGKEFPDRVLGGYIYSNYLYPPKSGVPDLEPNLFLVVAPNVAYGFRLYHEDDMKAWKMTVPFWGEKLNHAGYYDLPHKLIQSMGAPTPLGLDMFDLIFSTLDQYNFESLYIYGITCWSHGAASNYVLAALMWDPDIDIESRAEEFFRRAYGEESGRILRELYDTVQVSLKNYYLDHEDARYMLTEEMIRGIYVPIYPKLEAMYLEALEKAVEPDHIARVKMFGKAMILFRWNLEHMGLIEVDRDSPLHRTDEQIDAMLNEPDTWMLLSPDPDQDFPRTPEIVNPVRLRQRAERIAQDGGEKEWSTRGTLNIVVVPEGDQFTVKCPRLKHVGESPRLWVRNSQNETVLLAMIREGREISVSAPAGQPVLMTTTGSRARYTITIENAQGLKR